MHTMHYRRELLLVRRRAGRVVRRSGIVVDFIQRDAVATPAALEGPGIHIVDKYPLVQKTVGYVDLAGSFIELESPDTRGEDICLLVVLFHLRRRHFGPAMSKVPQKFPVLSEFNDAVARHGPGKIDIEISIHPDRLHTAGPARNIILAAPGAKNVAILIELNHLGPQNATFGARRIGRGSQFIGSGITLAIDDPDVVVFIDVDIHHLLHAPFVRQSLGPEWVYAVSGVLLPRCRSNSKPEERHRNGDFCESIPERHGGTSRR